MWEDYVAWKGNNSRTFEVEGFTQLSMEMVAGKVNMLIQSSFPSSIEASLSFVSDHGKHDLPFNWMPDGEKWQKCQICDGQHQSGCIKAVSILRGEKNDGDICSLSSPSCSQLSTHCEMSASSPNFVYHRRKIQRNSKSMLLAKDLVGDIVDGGLHSSMCSKMPSLAFKEGCKGEHEVETLNATNPSVMCCREADISRSESINGCSGGDGHGGVGVTENSLQKLTDFYSLNDSCSSSKSNMELCMGSMRTEVDDPGECSSSGVFTTEATAEDITEKDFCISILRREGLLGGNWFNQGCSFTEDIAIDDKSSCSQKCKVCARLEDAANMLICDQCEDAYHVTCCNPQTKKLPVDEWFCHSCFKKKHNILKDRSTKKQLKITSESARCRSATFEGDLGPIAFMLRDTEPYKSSVRVGKGFQADVPDSSGPITSDEDRSGEPLELDLSELVNLKNSSKPSRLSSIGNWLQCREVIDGVGDSVDGIICGKWRRAPLFEVQTDNWDCFSSVLWDPLHADCAVPQELETNEILKQLKYIEMLRPRLLARRRKLSSMKSDGLQEPKEGGRSKTS
ncbi:Zinc finger, PHD-finger [Dillenia turbinata]|uniref:Zinc finger, PHD-finger n=1 Tax=Dillenia turbinata TaxID=194707 RepID=A0AAN8ZK06_9MAGN